MAGEQEIEGFFVLGEFEEAGGDVGIEAAEADGAEAEGGGLEEEVLPGVSGFDVGDIAAAFAQFAGDAAVIGGENDDGGGLFDTLLAQGRGGEGFTAVAVPEGFDGIHVGVVAIEAGLCAFDAADVDVGAQRIDGPGGRTSPEPAEAGDTLKRPQQLPELGQTERRAGVFADGAPEMQTGFQRHGATGFVGRQGHAAALDRAEFRPALSG